MGIISLKGNTSSASIPDYDDGRWQSDFGWSNSELQDVYKVYVESTISEANVTNASVVNTAYETVGNGGRKLVRLSNGWLVAVVRNSTTAYYVYKSTDNGATWSQILSGTSMTALTDLCLQARGTDVYLIYSYANSTVYYRRIDAITNTSPNYGEIDTGQSSMGNVSLIMNNQSTELHACWSSTNSSYPNSYNIRYSKGTINADGSVTWGAVQQVVTSNTTGIDFKNPSIVLNKSGSPVILFERAYTSGYAIFSYYKSNGSWASNFVYNGGTYTQGFPSAIFVPKEINGLANGRIWVGWHGYDSTDNQALNVRVSYSDDGGETWSAMQKLTSGNNTSLIYNGYASLTFNASNEVFFLWHLSNQATGIISSKYTNGAWSTPTTLASIGGFPSSLYYMDKITSSPTPMFICRNTTSSKVAFYGTWKNAVVTGEEINIGEAVTSNSALNTQITNSINMDTTGNGGHNFVKLNNGWLVSQMYDTASYTQLQLFASKDKGSTWSQLCKVGVASNMSGHAIASFGNNIIVIWGVNSNVFGAVADATKLSSTDDLNNIRFDVDINLSLTGRCSLFINKEQTEVHASWSAKSSGNNSLNIVYKKGSINPTGSISWLASEIVTTVNTVNHDYNEPVIFLDSKNIPCIIFSQGVNSWSGTGATIASKDIIFLRKDNTLSTHAYLSTNWSYKSIYSTGTTAYSANFPSAIFVPKDINGLDNGRIWVSWHAGQSGYSFTNSMVGYSDDGGKTWSDVRWITSNTASNNWYTSITANKNNKIFVLWQGGTTANDSTNFSVKKMTWENGVWSGETAYFTNGKTTVCTLANVYLDFSEPLFTYKDSTVTKMLFYGVWKEGVMTGKITKTVKPADFKKWGNLKWTQNLPSNTNIVCDILDTNGQVILSNVKSLDELDGKITNSEIKIRWTLSRLIESATTPTISNPSITWNGEDILLDEVTGKKYKLVLDNKELFLEEV